MKYRYKVGDKVRVLDGSNIKGYTGGFVEGMKSYVGRIFEVLDYNKGLNRPAYHLNIDKSAKHFSFDERGLELADDTQKDAIAVYVDRRNPRKVIAKDNKTGIHASARCREEDEFNYYTGAKLAFDRLLSKLEEVRRRQEEESEFKVGDFVIGNSKAKKYAYTTEGTVWKVVKGERQICSGQVSLSRPGCHAVFDVEKSCFDKYTGSLLNGEYVCTKSPFDGSMTVGRIYTFNGGICTNDIGLEQGYYKNEMDLEEKGAKLLKIVK